LEAITLLGDFNVNGGALTFDILRSNLGLSGAFEFKVAFECSFIIDAFFFRDMCAGFSKTPLVSIKI